VEGSRFRLADEVRYIQNRAAEHDGRIITIGQLVLFSTETGDAWLLDRTDFLAARLARDGEAERSRSWKPRPRLPSSGRATIASMGRRSSIRIGIPVASPPSSGTQLTNSLTSNSGDNAQHRSGGKFQMCLASIEEQREIIRHSLHEIANDIGMVMRDAGLRFPVFITVRDNGDSLATIATPLDPSKDDWERTSAIVCQIIEKKIGGGRLRSRELLCAVANAAPMSAVEVTAEP
jgi:hypothetical protein